MIIMNDKMRNKIDKHKDYPSSDFINLCEKIVSNLILINDFLIYDYGNKIRNKKSNINWDRHIEKTNFLSAIEVSFNEIRVYDNVDVFAKESIIRFLDELHSQISIKFPDKKVGIIISPFTVINEDDEVIEEDDGFLLRIHTYREDEGYYIDNIEGFDSPVLYSVN